MKDNQKSMVGTLYLVPTPIGNMEDMTYRSVRILHEVDVIAAEDTRHTGLLLKHYGIHKPLISYHEHNKEEKGHQLIEMLLEGQNIAQVSDAGMPAISDPGADLVLKALEMNIPIVPLPGANAALTGLIASGLETRQFTFYGFLPKRASNRKAELQRLKSYEGTLIFYEAPHRLKDVLPDMYASFGNRPIVLARELTKKFETFLRTDLESLQENPEQVVYKGEFVLLVGGKETGDLPDTVVSVNEEPYELAVRRLVDQGINKKDAIREIAKQRGVSRREVYNAVEVANK